MTSSFPLYGQSLALLTDLYQLTMAYGYWKLGIAYREAVFHLSFRRQPFDSGFSIACGLQSAIDFIQQFHFSEDDLTYLATLRGEDGNPLFEKTFLDHLRTLRLTCDIDAIPEGTVVFPHEPLVRVKGSLLQCQLLETVLLNMLNFSTLIATKAARICMAARGEPVLEFGLRRAQAIDGALTASRAAYVGGCAATSNVLAGKLFGIPVKGTHAHSWVMSFDSEPEAFDAYARVMPNNVVLLVDTYDTLEGVRHAAEVGRHLHARGHRLAGIRLDSGDLAYLSIEARKILDAAGLTDTAILASNDLDENIIRSLKDQGATINVWGVGTKLVTAYDQPALGGVYKLSALRSANAAGGGGGAWEHKIKLSEQLAKTSVPGILQVRRYKVGGEFRADMIVDELRTAGASPAVSADWSAPTQPGSGADSLPHDAKGPNAGAIMIDPMDATRRKVIAAHTEYEDLLIPIFRRGNLVYDLPTLPAIRTRTQQQLASLHPSIKRPMNPHQYPVGLEKSLHDLRQQMILHERGVVV
ncbi:MAG TPA: nicotinate phosphoribosyltransferase [Phycisphaerae bacterium]|nr:nicotinate phosphoribosyltransferase [Phycisphaerae bacterium]